MSLNKLPSSGHGKTLSSREHQIKVITWLDNYSTSLLDDLQEFLKLNYLIQINEVRNLIGSLSNKFPSLCSDASISRYLNASNWNTKKATRMLKQTIQWRLDYKPETIRWDEVADEAKTGKIYRANYADKFGRPVLVMRPGLQNTNSIRAQIKYLVYCMENALLNLGDGQKQMVWLIDLQGWNMASVSVKVTRETAHILQDHYPETLALGILYNPPKIFESFLKIVKPFLDPETYKKVRFVYSGKPESQKIMEELFDMDNLESAFGGHNLKDFDYSKPGERTEEDDRKFSTLLTSENQRAVPPSSQLLDSSLPQFSETTLKSALEIDSDASNETSSSTEDSSPESSVIDEPPEDQLTGNAAAAAAMSVEEDKADAVQMKDACCGHECERI